MLDKANVFTGCSMVISNSALKDGSSKQGLKKTKINFFFEIKNPITQKFTKQFLRK